ILMAVPSIATATIYSEFTKKIGSGDLQQTKTLFKILQNSYQIYSVTCFIIVYTLSDTILLTAFGNKYYTAIDVVKQMSLVILVFPNVLLQANLIVAMKKEKIDM